MNSVSKGLFCDIHPSRQPEDTLRDCWDGYVATRDRGQVWVPIDGTTELPLLVDGLSGAFSGRIMEIVSVGSRTVLIAMVDGNVTFYERTIDSSVNLTKLAQLPSSELFTFQAVSPPNYDMLKLNSCFGGSDGNGNDYVYLTSGNGQPLCVPIGTSYKELSVGQCRYMPEAAGLQLSATEIDGALPCGAYMFSVQLFNMDGATTQWTPPTLPIEIGSSKWKLPLGNGLTTILGVSVYEDSIAQCRINGLSGGSTTDVSLSGVKLTVAKNDAISYERMRIACFVRGKDGASTVGYICYEGVYAAEISYTIKNYIRTILTSDVLVQPVELINVSAIDFYRDVQAVGGFDEFDGLAESERFKVSNGSVLSEIKPIISTVARKVKKIYNNKITTEDVTPRLYDLRDAVFAPLETYEIAALPVSKSGTMGNVVKLGTITMPDYAVDDVLKCTSCKNEVIYDPGQTNKQSVVPSFPVFDIKLSGIDLSMFNHPNVDHVEIVYRNISNRVVGYGTVTTPIKWNDDNAGGMLPSFNCGVRSIFNNNLILHLPEHLFGKLDASQLKDMEVELFDCYNYDTSIYGGIIKNFISFRNDYGEYKISANNEYYSDPDASKGRMDSTIPWKSKYTIQNAMELSYSNANDVIFDGLTGARRNGTIIYNDQCKGYGGKSLLLKLTKPYPVGSSIPWFGYCRVLRPLQSTDSSNLFRRAGVSIKLSDCTVTDRVVAGVSTKAYTAPDIILTVGDRYARLFTCVTLMPNGDDINARREIRTIPIYSHIDTSHRVGSHFYINNHTYGLYGGTTYSDGIGLNRDKGYAKLEDFSIHDHYVDATPPFTWSCIEEELRTSLRQHIRWAVKRTANSRHNELRRFLANDIAVADLGGGAITAVRFLSDTLMVVQDRAIGRMPYNEKVPIGSKNEIFLGTGKEFSSYYRITTDGCSSNYGIAQFGDSLLVNLSANGIIAIVGASTNVNEELHRIDLLSMVGVASHPNIKGKHSTLSCTPMVNGVSWLSMDEVAVALFANGGSVSAMGITSTLPRTVDVVGGKLYSASYDSVNSVSKMYIHSGGSTLYGRQLSPSLTVVLRQDGQVIEPLSVFLKGLICPVKDIVLTAEEQATGGYDGYGIMERRYHRYENDGWRLTMPKASIKGCRKSPSGPYLILTLTFPVDSQKLANFGYVNEYDVSYIIKR